MKISPVDTRLLDQNVCIINESNHPPDIHQTRFQKLICCTIVAIKGVLILKGLGRPLDKLAWRPPSPSELTPIISYMGLTHLGSEASTLDDTFFPNLKCPRQLIVEKLEASKPK